MCSFLEFRRLENIGTDLITGVKRPASFKPPTFAISVVLVVAVLMRSGYALTTTTEFPTTVPILFLMAVILSLFALLAPNLILVPPTLVAPWVCLALLVISLNSSLWSKSAELSVWIVFMLTIVASYSLSRVVQFQTFVSWFVGAIASFSVVAVLAQFLFVWLKLPIPLRVISNVNGAEYSNGFVVFFLTMWDGSLINRALGPFWEPGVFASFAILAMLLETSFRKAGPRKWVLALLVLTVLVSGSTAGYVLLLPVMWLPLMHRFPRFGVPVGAVMLIAAFVGVFFFNRLASGLTSISPSLFSKLNDDSVSSITRVNSLFLNLALFEESPWVGWGLNGATQEYVGRMADWNVAAQTSTSLYFLAAFGLGGVLVSLFWVFAVWGCRDINTYSKLAVLTCLFAVLNKEPHIFNMATWTLLFCFLSRGEPDGGSEPNVV